jgi:hypothetical protein
MNMNEYIVNLHVHTSYSDGTGSHAEIARAAMQAGLDAVIVTDHNVWVKGVEGYYQENQKRVLMLVGEEIHNQAADPQKNHLLVFNAGRELAQAAVNPQRLIASVRQAGGLSFLAHPFEAALPAFGEPDISWVDWQVQGYTGLELWNGFSEFKSRVHSPLQAVFYAFFPRLMAQGPLPQTLAKWDELLASGQRISVIGGADAHALHKQISFVHKTIFPYAYHFSAINTHIHTPEPLSGDANQDRQKIMDALKYGHAFIGYDLPGQTRGFRFTAQSKDALAWMGDEIPARGGVTFQVHLPAPASVCRLVCNGQVIRTWNDRDNYTYITTQPGVYRVEAYHNFMGAPRGWIFSNPIYLI